jgi:hypothetical protein
MSENRSGWLLFAGIMIFIAGVLNTIYGIGAISDSKFFVDDTKYIFSSLNTWGWITLIVGVFQLIAAVSIWRGGGFGMVIGMTVAMISAIVALLSIASYPLLSLAIFAVDVLIIYGLATYGGQRTTTGITA